MRLFWKNKRDTANELMQMLTMHIPFNTPLRDIAKQADAVTKGYMYNHIIYAIVNRIANTLSGVPFTVYRVTDRKAAAQAHLAFKRQQWSEAIELKELAYEIDTANQIAELLKQPNENESLNDLIVALSSFYLITGNGYLYGLRRETAEPKDIIRLYVMPSHKTKIVFGNYLNPVKGYEVGDFLNGVIKPEDVLHIKNFNPQYDSTGSWLYGLSPIQAAGTLISMSNSSYETQLSNFDRYGIRGLLSGNGELTQQQAETLKDKWREVVENRKGDVLIAGTPLHWVNIGLSPVDLQIIEQQKLTLRDLCMIYSVPSQLFGDAEHVTYNNMREARKALITDATLPLLEKIKDGLNRFLCSGTEYVIDYDVQVFIELQDDVTQQVNALATAWWLTPNEKRVAMGKQPVDNEIMDEVLLPSMGLPISEYSNNEFYGNSETEE